MEQVSERASEQTNDRSGARERSVQNKQMGEKCEQRSLSMSKRPDILWVNFMAILPNVRLF